MSSIETIRRYISTSKTSHAILVNGKWGSGKTYYWINVIEPQIKAIPVPDKSVNYNPVYITLYGLETTSDIGSQILHEIAAKKNKTITQVMDVAIKGIKAAASAFIDVSQLAVGKEYIARLPLLKQCVLAFDDIERISDEKLIEPVLGYLNSLAEHHNIKIIILTDEEKLQKKNIDWKSIKEKTISDEIVLDVDYDNVIDEIIGKYLNKEYRDFLSEYKNIVKEAFIKSETKNLRSLIFGLDRFSIIFPRLQKNIDTRKFQDHLLYSTLILSFEYKKGTLEFDDTIANMNHFMLENAEKLKYFYKWDDSKINVFKNFFSRYFPNYSKWHFIITPAFYTFIITGFEQEILVIDLIKNYSSTNVFEKEIAVLKILRSYKTRPLEQSEFDELIKDLLLFTSTSKFDLYYYPVIYELLLDLKKDNLIYVTNQQIDELVSKGIKSAQKSYNPDMQLLLEIELETTQNKFFDEVIKINHHVRKEEFKKSVEEATELLLQGDYTFFLDLVFNSRNLEELFVLDFINIHDFVETFHKIKNDFLFSFADRLEARFDSKDISDNKNILSVLIDEIDSLVSEFENMKRFSILKLRNTASQLVKNEQ